MDVLTDVETCMYIPVYLTRNWFICSLYRFTYQISDKTLSREFDIYPHQTSQQYHQVQAFSDSLILSEENYSFFLEYFQNSFL